MILDCRFAVTNWTGDAKLLALVDSHASFSLLSSLVAKHLGWAIKLNNTPVVIKLANRTVVA